MSQEFQGGVCEGNWWMMNSSQNFFRTSPCSSSISDFGWQNHDLVKNLESLSHGNNPQILQEDANYFLHPSMNYTQQNEYSPTLQDSSFDSLKNQTVFPANHEQRLISSSSEDFAAAYSYDPSALLQHLFDTDSQEHESLLENLGLNYTQAMNCQNTGSFDGGQKDSDTNHLQFGNNMQYWKDSTEFSCDVGVSVSRSTTQPQFTASSFSRTKANKISNSTVKHHNEEKKTIINEQPTTAKRSRIETPTPSPLPSFKVRKEKLGDRITALQQLVSPFGKTDTASVLHEAIDYIKFLHDQVRVLSTPYMKNARGPEQYQQKTDNNNNNKDLKSRGLCVVPISSTFPVATETTADFWTPNFGGNFKR